ncbi:hypothetical protein [Spartinivicinus poritis]|uniref:Uncharacterized protein n=1 Tax=Spartinivicinus poritis TaxID=2994640 RepID=A0ABT5U3L1_9GAMM|nr:hypothetical protein [Spartinivicinus sp. A2-2]MDE1460953.1 hypothetical protein [Spartinivicinus sp. A2-2]
MPVNANGQAQAGNATGQVNGANTSVANEFAEDAQKVANLAKQFGELARARQVLTKLVSELGQLNNIRY